MKPTVESRLGFENKIIENRGSRRNAKRCDETKFQRYSRNPDGEGSRPRDPMFAERITFFSRRRKYAFWLGHVLAAREDARPPWIVWFQAAGFSLIEMLVVVTIIAAIAALVTTAVMSALQQQNARVCQNNMLTIEAAKDEYIRDHPGATSIDENAFAQYFRFGIPKCPDGGTYNNLYVLTQQVSCSRHGKLQAFPSATP
jgi:prepilin-type N-terminal cleavage/methylation domain-containing protein